MNWTDRDLLTFLVNETAAALHREHLQLSIATVPNAPGYPGKGAFSHWLYANWRGAFDLKALAQSFIASAVYPLQKKKLASGASNPVRNQSPDSRSRRR